jgi:hypothetical protein
MIIIIGFAAFAVLLLIGIAFAMIKGAWSGQAPLHRPKPFDSPFRHDGDNRVPGLN